MIPKKLNVSLIILLCNFSRRSAEAKKSQKRVAVFVLMISLWRNQKLRLNKILKTICLSSGVDLMRGIKSPRKSNTSKKILQGKNPTKYPTTT